MATATPREVPAVFGPDLPGADWADAHEILCAGEAFTARDAAIAAIDRPPVWIDALLVLRNLIVMPFGLKGTPRGPGRIGIFPVVSESPERVVLGFDDTHLDFRILVEVQAANEATLVRATTLVRRNNAFGRFYLAAIMPFHKLIVRRVLKGLSAWSGARQL